ncbi:hypothetical protein A7A09_004105 [Paracoccus methylarcula]|uniref:Uncharacterized protein n=1 Tax=Paracoccus methylarcula TaxID=72022 RepID=A0A3R7NYS5_9RHOB|nr:hypothetical protein A7A09_004105 [Paracoccus methylarcula]
MMAFLHKLQNRYASCRPSSTGKPRRTRGLPATAGTGYGGREVSGPATAGRRPPGSAKEKIIPVTQSATQELPSRRLFARLWKNYLHQHRGSMALAFA